MSEVKVDWRERLVVGRKRDGRCIYDEGAKLELIQACRRPGVSMAKFARECGVNANQLSSWVRQYERQCSKTLQSEVAVVDELPFVAVKIQGSPEECKASPALGMQVKLPNGVVIELQGCDLAQASTLIHTLGGLRCSASTIR